MIDTVDIFVEKYRDKNLAKENNPIFEKNKNRPMKNGVIIVIKVVFMRNSR